MSPTSGVSISEASAAGVDFFFMLGPLEAGDIAEEVAGHFDMDPPFTC